MGKGRARFRQDFLLYPVEILPYVYVLILCLILDFLFMQVDPQVGLWDCLDNESETHGVHLFHYHSRYTPVQTCIK